MNIEDKKQLVTLWNQLVNEQGLIKVYESGEVGIETNKLHYDKDNSHVVFAPKENGEQN
ncbi:hypothetical protein LW81_067 [Lactococcus phage LW81]|uniref:Uncharacterized protein n=1 Tax=Lactococcus phage LW81 TaxID=1965482 RepID=A0A1W6JN68_9CAUD|nr:hypothetical protein H1Z34_gp067 [Lactococcus phage LW81]ARM67637.1 hypothetical protein LW81_067 [Lactococcus phage LW81]